MAGTSLAVVAAQLGATVLPDDSKTHMNRLQIRSESSNALYVVSQRRTTGAWECSCRGWISHRHCKHLRTMVPTLESATRAAQPEQPQPAQKPAARPVARIAPRVLPRIDAINAIPRQPQSQAALNDQLRALRVAAQRLGLYDAADYIRSVVGE